MSNGRAAGGGARTHTALRPLDFESSASASSATPAFRKNGTIPPSCPSSSSANKSRLAVPLFSVSTASATSAEAEAGVRSSEALVLA